MGKIKISEMATGNIAANDLIPFVQVPTSNIKSNKKTTFSSLKAAVLQGISVGSGGVCTPSNLIFTDGNDMQLIAEYLIVNAIVPENNPEVGQENYSAIYANDLSEDVIVLVDIPISCYSAVDELVLSNVIGDTGHAWASYKIELLADNNVIGCVSRTVDFFKTQEGVLTKLLETHDDNLTGNIIAPANSAIIFTLRLTIKEFICKSIPLGTQQALQLRMVPNLVPDNSFNCFTFKIPTI
jgi:hypothetical protein